MRREVRFYTPHDVAEIDDKKTLQRLMTFYNRLSVFENDIEETYVGLMRLCIWKRLLEL